jgi:GDP-mannose 6-dehydrogenase
MKVTVFGLGYVGVVTSSCLAREGHEVVGVDVAGSKVDMVNAGRTPIVEEGVAGLIADGVTEGRLRATTDAEEAVARTDLALICVGTPSRADGSLDQRYLAQVLEQIGGALRARTTHYNVVVRSTIVPGTLRDLVIPTLERSSGRPVGTGYEVSFHPEFLREGTAVRDFYHPPKIVVGERAPGTGRAVMDLYGAKFDAPRVSCSFEIAEMVKYCDNLFHAVKVTFANEVGIFCHAHGIDSKRVMEIFCSDTKLNVSAKYLQPGFAFGGSCLPKDLRAFLSVARTHSLRVPMLEQVLPSNSAQIERALDLILASGCRRVGLHGIAFKPGTDDLRESPLVELAERLLGKGRRIILFDEEVEVARLVGGNKSFVEQKLPHLAELLTSRIADFDGCDLIVLGHDVGNPQLESWLTSGKQVLDLTGNRSSERRTGLTCIV